jgi:hypothetical protein
MEIQLSFQLKVDITKYVYDTAKGEKSMKIQTNVKKISPEIVNQTTEALFRPTTCLPNQHASILTHNQFINNIFGIVTIIERQTKHCFPNLDINIKLKCEETVNLTDMNIDYLIEDMANLYDCDYFEVEHLSSNGMMTEYGFQVTDNIPKNIHYLQA